MIKIYSKTRPYKSVLWIIKNYWIESYMNLDKELKTGTKHFSIKKNSIMSLEWPLPEKELNKKEILTLKIIFVNKLSYFKEELNSVLNISLSKN